MRSPKRRIARFAVIGGAAALALPAALAVGNASAAGSTPTAPVTVTGGMTATMLPGATVLGQTAPATAEHVSFVLRAQHEAQLASQVQQGVSSYLTPQQFAATYGQSGSYLAQLKQYLAGYGISTDVDTDGLIVRATGTASQFDGALSVSQEQVHVAARPGKDGTMGLSAQTVHAITSEPKLPASLASEVLAAPGLTDYAAFVSQAVHPNAQPQKPGTHGGTCLTGALTDTYACHTPSYFATQYDLNQLYSGGAQGQGETIGIVTLAALNTTAPGHFWSTVLHMAPSGRTVTTVTVDGGPGAPSTKSGSGETDLDTEQSGALAPDANVVVFQAANTLGAFVTAFAAAADDATVSTVSASWGLSEAILRAYHTTTLNAYFDEVFQQMAVEGQSVFVASDDEGAYAASRDLGSTTIGIQVPSDSPYVTAAGGTSTPWQGTFATKTTGHVKAPVSLNEQRTWGWDYAWSAMAKTSGKSLATTAEHEVVGGGGGYSLLEPMPSYQKGVSGTTRYSDVEYLTPTNDQTVKTVTGTSATSGQFPWTWSFDPSPRVGHGTTTTGRAVPDVSADADPFSGYLLYGPTGPTNVMTLAGGWGGTSFVAPQLNGSTAVIESALGHRVGFWNPQIYAFATGRSSPFTPLDQSGPSNDNLFYTGTPGTVYNPASGLGYPDLAQLESDFAGGGGRGRSGGPGPREAH